MRKTTSAFYRSLTRSKTVVPYRPKSRTLPRFAPQVPINPGYPLWCRGRRKVF